MKRYLPCMVSLALAATAAHNADADTTPGWYMSGNVGIGWLGSEDLSFNSGTAVETSNADFDPSFAGGATAGYRLNDNWRLEGELMYRRNELSGVDLPSISGQSISDGDFASLSLGASVLYDIDLLPSPKVRTYVGAGVVLIQEIDIDFEVAGVETSFETDEVAFQLQAGARYDLGDQLFLDAGIRYLSASGVKLELPADSQQTLTSDYSPLTLSVGVGWRF